MTTTPGAISTRSSSLADLADDRVHAAGGDDLVADLDVVLHRRVRRAGGGARARASRNQPTATRTTMTITGPMLAESLERVALVGVERAPLDRLARAAGQLEEEA